MFNFITLSTLIEVKFKNLLLKKLTLFSMIQIINRWAYIVSHSHDKLVGDTEDIPIHEEGAGAPPVTCPVPFLDSLRLF